MVTGKPFEKDFKVGSSKKILLMDQLFLVASIGFAVGLSTSKVVLSISTMLMVVAVLWKGEIGSLKERLTSKSTLLPLLIYLLIHLIALGWTSDFSYALNDLKTKVTLLLIPIAFAAHPLKKTSIELILFFFVACLAVTSLVNILAWHHIVGNKEYTDIRELSLFGSHIRYGILIAMGAGICCIYAVKHTGITRWSCYLLVVWFAYYTYFSQIISGLLAFISVFVALGIWFVHQRCKIVAKLLLMSYIILILSVVIYLSHIVGNVKEINYSPKNDAITLKESEAFFSENQLRKTWNSISTWSYDGSDQKGQPLRFTLQRYLTDLGLPQNSVGITRLRSSDIELIEKGIASRAEGKGGLTARWRGIQYQLKHSLNPNGHSLLQRIEYWKTAWRIIKANYLFGVGTGDVQKAFDNQYEHDKSKLQANYRLRAHNTYLTSWISFGIAGLLVLLWMTIYYVSFSLKHHDPMALIFILVSATSFLLEDTLETQVGASFFAFFYGLCYSISMNDLRFKKSAEKSLDQSS
jgi:hypothetical protein